MGIRSSFFLIRAEHHVKMFSLYMLVCSFIDVLVTIYGLGSYNCAYVNSFPTFLPWEFESASLGTEITLTDPLQNDMNPVEVTKESTTTFTSEFSKITGKETSDEYGHKYGDEDYHRVLDKPIMLGNFSIADASPIIVNDLYLQLCSNATIAPIFQRYRYVRCGLEVTIVVNSSPYFYGAAVAALVPRLAEAPFCNNISCSSSINSFNQIIQMKHVKVDYSASESYILDIPFLGSNDYIHTFDFGNNPGYPMVDLWIYPINYPACIDSVSVPNPTINVALYLRAVKPEFLYLDVHAPEAHPNGILSTPLKGFADVVRQFSPIPKYTSPYVSIADGLASFLSLLGYGKMAIKDTTVVAENANLNFNAEDGRAVIQTVANQTNQAVDLSLPGVPFFDPNDMLFEKICNKWGYLGTSVIDSNQSAGTIFEKYAIGPWSIPVTYGSSTDVYYTTPWQYCASAFLNCRCDMEVKIEVQGTTFHRGVLGFGITREYSGYSHDDLINESRVHFMDLSKTREITIDFKYNDILPYMQREENVYAYSKSYSATPSEAMIGWMPVTICTPISVGINSQVQKVYVNVFARIKGTPYFQQPNLFRMNAPARDEGGTPLEVFTFHSKDLNATTFGETFSSVKQLANIYAPTYRALMLNGVSYSFPLFLKCPIPTLDWADGTNIPLGNQDSYGFECYVSFLAYVSQMYYGQKGGVRVFIPNFYNQDADDNPTLVADFQLNAIYQREVVPPNYFISGLTLNQLRSLYQKSNAFRGRTVVNDATSHGYQFRIPDFTNSRLYPGNMSLYNWSTTTTIQTEMECPLLQVYGVAKSSSAAGVVVPWYASDDDMQFVFFRFTPNVERHSLS